MVQTVQVRRADVGEWQAVRLTPLADSPFAFGSTLGREVAFDNQEWQRRGCVRRRGRVGDGGRHS